MSVNLPDGFYSFLTLIIKSAALLALSMLSQLYVLLSIATLGSSLRPSSLKPRRGSTAASAALDDESDAVAMAVRTVTRCARDRSTGPEEMLKALDILRAARPRPPSRDSFGGTWELVWNDKIAKVPMINGYMPNKEVLTWDLERGVLELTVATLPLLPEIKIRGENLTYDDGVLTYTVGDKPPSTWDVFHADGDVVAAVSSATGVNVIRRIG